MRTRYDEFGIEIKEPSKIPVILFIIIVFIVVASLIFLVINLADTTKEKPKESTNTKEIENQPTMDEHSTYNEEAALVVPQISNTTIYKVENLNINILDLKADQSGYILRINVYNTDSIKNYIIDCDKIAIDSYETSASFKIVLAPYTNETITTRIPLEELNNLEIIDFNKLTFFLTINQDGKIQNTQRDIRMEQRFAIDNTKKGLLKIDEKNNVLINYYRKIEDETDTYLYFEIENNSKKNHLIRFKKLIVNNKLYEIKDFKLITHFETKNIFYIKIPKKSIDKINKIRVSFFLFESDINGKATYITVEKELSI